MIGAGVAADLDSVGMMVAMTTPTPQPLKPIHPFIPTAAVFLMVVAVGAGLAFLFKGAEMTTGLYGTAVDGTTWAKDGAEGGFNFLIFSVFIAAAFPTAAITCVGSDLRRKV